MSGWLVIFVAAPMASFGEEPGNALRGSAAHPTRSALLGLAGAALGIPRAEAAAQEKLFSSFLIATRTISPGSPLADFHTFQSLPSAKGRVATRREALIERRDDLQTSITRREYRADGAWQAAFSPTDKASISLAGLREAFVNPHFLLYAGRKSCPLAHPLAPLMIEADSADVAFRGHARYVNERMGAKVIPAMGGMIAIDERQSPTHANATRRHRRNDEPGNRERWHFSSRFEYRYTMPEGPDGVHGEQP